MSGKGIDGRMVGYSLKKFDSELNIKKEIGCRGLVAELQEVVSLKSKHTLLIGLGAKSVGEKFQARKGELIEQYLKKEN